MTHAAEKDDQATAERLCQAFVHYQDELMGMLAAMLGSPEEAGDALQEALWKCWRRRQYLVEIEDLRAWVFRMTLNAGRDLRGRSWRQKGEAGEEAEGSAEAAAAPAGSIGSGNDPTRRDVRQAIAMLPSDVQEVFLLRQNGRMTYSEIGRALNLPEGTVRARMRLALERLQAALPGGD